MTGPKRRRVSRRWMLWAGGASAVTAATASLPLTQAGAADRGGGNGAVSTAARVVGHDGSRLRVVSLDTGAPLGSIPPAGFPASAPPRVGDLVTLTDQWSGYPLALVPLCAWVKAQPEHVGGSRYRLSNQQAEDPQALLPGMSRSANARVCLMQTQLPTALVLAVRD